MTNHSKYFVSPISGLYAYLFWTNVQCGAVISKMVLLLDFINCVEWFCYWREGVLFLLEFMIIVVK